MVTKNMVALRTFLMLLTRSMPTCFHSLRVMPQPVCACPYFSMPFILTPYYDRLLPLGSQAWGNVLSDLDFFIQNGNGKKIYFDEVKHFATSISTPFSRLTICLFRTHRMAGLPKLILEWSPIVIPPSRVSRASNNILPSSTPTAPTSRLSLAVALVGSLTSIRTHRSPAMGSTALLGSSSFPSPQGRPAE
jgi:hypothetical protein